MVTKLRQLGMLLFQLLHDLLENQPCAQRDVEHGHGDGGDVVDDDDASLCAVWSVDVCFDWELSHYSYHR